jgi:hypothetical protein
MKYERKSPYADGFNDIYTVAGVDADDVWARKRMLLGGDGGDGGAGGHAGTDPAVDNPETVAEAEAEAQAQAEAKGEMEAYDQSFGFVTDALGITKGFDEFGPKGVNISFSPVGMALSSVVGLGPLAGMALSKGVTAALDAFDVPSTVSVNIGTPGTPGISFGPSTPGAIDNAISSAISSVTGTTGGTTTGTQGGVNDGIGGFDTPGNSDPAFAATDLSSDTMLGRTLVEKDLDPGGNASAIIPVPINTSAAPAGIFQVDPTTRPLAYAPSPSPFFQQQNFNPFAVPPLGVPTQTAPFVQPMRYGGAVNSGIGSLVSIR